MEEHATTSAMDFAKGIPGLESYIREEKGLLTDREVALKRLKRFMKECVLQHRWADLWKCLLIFNNARLCTLKSGASDANSIWRFGVEAMEHNPEFDNTDLEIFLREIDVSDVICKEQMRVEQVMHLASQGELEKALLLSKRKVNRKCANFLSESLKKYSKAWDQRRVGLTGILEYLRWLKEKDRDDSPDSGDDTDSGQYSTSAARELIAEESIACFLDVSNMKGCTDIYITKYVELLESLDRIDEAIEALKKNVTLNPSNPNSHKYLYNFLKKHNKDSGQLLEVLKGFVEQNPSDELVIDFVELSLELDHEDKEQVYASCLSALFSLLDHVDWNDQVKPWSLLKDLLCKVLKSYRGRGTLTEIWKIRETTWPYFQFYKKDVSRTYKTSPKLLLDKACIVIYLIGPDVSYVKSVKKCFQRKNNVLKLAKLKKACKVHKIYHIKELKQDCRQEDSACKRRGRLKMKD